MHLVNQEFAGEDRRKSWTITIIVHALLLLLALLPFITDMPDNEQYLQAITINFEEPPVFDDFSSKQSGAAAAAASAESASPEAEQTPREQVALASVTPVQPATVMPVPTREIVTTEAQPEVFVPSSPSKNSDRFFDQPLEVVDRVEVDRVEAFKEKPNPALQQQVTWHATDAEVTEKGAPTSFDFGNGQGTGSGQGTSPNGSTGSAPKGDREDGVGHDPFGDGSFPGGTGSGTGNKGNDTGVGNEGKGLQWGDFAGDGLFNRKVIERANVAQIATVEGKVVVNLCVDQSGKVVYAQYDVPNSTIRDRTVLSRAVDYAKRYLFEKDASAPKEQCGRLTFIFKIQN